MILMYYSLRNRGNNLKNKKKKRFQNKKSIKKMIAIVLISILIIITIVITLGYIPELNGAWKPDYPKTDLGEMINKSELSDEDYETLLMQTGLGKPAVDTLLNDTNTGKERERLFQNYQDDFFALDKYECRRISGIVYEEKIRNDKGEPLKAFEIADIRNGDILITKATHTLGWRHGHAALVINAEKGETLEAFEIGYNSNIQHITKWQTYPSFIHLRLKENADVIGEDIATFAMKNVYDIPYSLFTGIPQKAPKGITKTQCSHLVWYPYLQFGYDIDSDGSWLVTPKDIANSDLFEVVQVYGFDPEKMWK